MSQKQCKMNRRDALGMMSASLAALASTRWSAAIGVEPFNSAAIVTRPVPSSKEALPVVGLGTWQVFDVGTSPEARAPLEEVLSTFVAMGGKLVDSSPMYGRSEEVIGDIAARLGLRQKLFVATKVWTSGKIAGIEQMEASMRKLRTDPIDLMQVHNLVDVATQLETLRDWKREGRVRYIGVTHYDAASYDAVAKIMASQSIDFIQINYSVGEREAERHILPLALERGMAVIANRPFAGGELIRSLQGRPLPDWAGEVDCTSWAQILLKFVVSHPAIGCAIPGTSKVEHLRDNMGAGYGRLPDENIRARIISSASQA